MGCNTSPAAKTYAFRTLITMLFYVALVVVAVYLFKTHPPTGAIAYVVGILPALPCIAVFVFAGIYLNEETDEFQRSIVVQSMLWASGVTFSFTTAWGFLENFSLVPHFDLYLVMVIFWLSSGLANFAVRARYR